MYIKISFIYKKVLHLTVRAYLNDNLPRWIGRASGEDNVMLKWPQRSPDLTPCDFFLWGYVKTRAQTKNHYRTGDSYPRHAASCLEDLDYRLDMCRVTGVAHIERL